jgi:hypothetical protein
MDALLQTLAGSMGIARECQVVRGERKGIGVAAINTVSQALVAEADLDRRSNDQDQLRSIFT